MTHDIHASLLAGMAAALAACASVDAITSRYAGVPRYPETSASDVRILRVMPLRPYERVGEIVMQASFDPAPSIDEVEDKLRSETAKLGADAAVVMHDHIQSAYVYGPYWSRSIDLVNERKVVALAIKLH